MFQVATHMMFQGDAAAALSLYVSVFPDFVIEKIENYGEAEDGNSGTIKPGTIKEARVSFAGHRLIVIDSPIPHAFTFTPSVSMFVDFDDEDTLEAAFSRLSQGGETLMPLDNYGFSQRFGWLKDRFGMSWQLNLPAD